MCVTCNTGIVHENVDRTERADCLFKERDDGSLVRDVAPAGPRTAAARDDGRFELARRFLALAERDCNRCTALRQRFHNGSSDAAGSSGHNGDPAGKAHVIA